MKSAKMLTILILALAQVASAAQSLTVNGEALDAITLKTGQACTVEVVSDNSNPYSAYVGFDDRVVLGSFDEPLEMPEAGDLASITEYDVPAFYGYYVSAAGTSPPPSPGVHFVIEYEPQQVGETELKLYDPLRMTVIATVHITVVAAEIGTVFTYQGRLMEAGNPSDGQYDFEFILYNAPSYGTQLAGTVEVNDLDVIDGYFTVELDFGSDVFDGDARWLEVGVRPGVLTDPNLYVTLPERQPVTACPYALQTRGIFVDSRLNVGIGTTSPKGKLHINGGKARSGADGGDIMIEGQDGGDGGKPGGNDGGDGSNIILLPGKGGEPGLFGVRGRDGNVGIGTTKPSTKLDVVGTVNATAFVGDGSGLTNLPANPDSDWVIDGNDMYSALSGNVGIGTESPDAKLEVAGDVTVKKIGEDVDISLVSGTGSSSKLLFGNRFEPGAAAIKFDNLTQVLSFKNWLTDDALVITQDGKVGIGTTNPSSRLNVAQDSSAWVEGIRLTYGGYDWDIVSGGESLYIAPNQTITEGIVIKNGKVGIGTGSPEEELHVEGDARISRDLWVQDDLTVTGRYMGSFPRPAYDSGWFGIPPNNLITLNHNLGGNVDNYVVDMQFKNSVGSIHNRFVGSNYYWSDDSGFNFFGAHWTSLTTNTIKVARGNEDDTWEDAHEIRIRIWVYQ